MTAKRNHALWGEAPVDFIDRLAEDPAATGAWLMPNRTAADAQVNMLRTYATRRGLTLNIRRTQALPWRTASDQLVPLILVKGDEL